MRSHNSFLAWPPLLALLLGLGVAAAQSVPDKARTWTTIYGKKAQGVFIQLAPPTGDVWKPGKENVILEISGVVRTTPMEMFIPSDQKLIEQLAQKFPGPQFIDRGRWLKSADGEVKPKDGYPSIREEGSIDLHGVAIGMTDVKVIERLVAGGFTPGKTEYVVSMEGQVAKEVNLKSANRDREIDNKLPRVIKQLNAAKREGADTTWQITVEFKEDTTADKDRIIAIEVRASLHSTAFPMGQVTQIIKDAMVAKHGNPTSEKYLTWGKAASSWQKDGDKVSVSGFTAMLENGQIHGYLETEAEKHLQMALDAAFKVKANGRGKLSL